MKNKERKWSNMFPYLKHIAIFLISNFVSQFYIRGNQLYIKSDQMVHLNYLKDIKY